MNSSDIGVGKAEVSAHTMSTDARDGDGTFRWDSTTLIICEIHAAGEIGFGYSYGIQATAFVADYLAGKFLLQLTRASLDTAAEGALPTTMGNSLRSCLAGWHNREPVSESNAESNFGLFSGRFTS
jgi:hypothetical protein